MREEMKGVAAYKHHGVEVHPAHDAAYSVTFLHKLLFPGRVYVGESGVLLRLGASPRRSDGGDEPGVPRRIGAKCEKLVLVRISTCMTQTERRDKKGTMQDSWLAYHFSDARRWGIDFNAALDHIDFEVLRGEGGLENEAVGLQFLSSDLCVACP